MNLRLMLAVLSAVTLLVASLLKLQSPYEASLSYYFAFLEPFLAVVIISAYRHKLIRMLFGFLFIAMSLFLLYTILIGGFSCDCFGAHNSLPAWLVFSFDSSLGLLWLLTCSTAYEEDRLSKSGHIFSMFFVLSLVSIGFFTQQYMAKQLLKSDTKLFFSESIILESRSKDIDQILLSADAVFVARVGCGRCVALSKKFSNVCEDLRIRGFICVPSDFTRMPLSR